MNDGGNTEQDERCPGCRAAMDCEPDDPCDCTCHEGEVLSPDEQVIAELVEERRDLFAQMAAAIEQREDRIDELQARAAEAERRAKAAGMVMNSVAGNLANGMDRAKAVEQLFAEPSTAAYLDEYMEMEAGELVAEKRVAALLAAIEEHRDAVLAELSAVDPMVRYTEADDALHALLARTATDPEEQG